MAKHTVALSHLDIVTMHMSVKHDTARLIGRLAAVTDLPTVNSVCGERIQGCGGALRSSAIA